MCHFSTICQFAKNQCLFVPFTSKFNARISLVWDREPGQKSRAQSQSQGSQKGPWDLTRTPSLGVKEGQVLSTQEPMCALETAIPLQVPTPHSSIYFVITLSLFCPWHKCFCFVQKENHGPQLYLNIFHLMTVF